VVLHNKLLLATASYNSIPGLHPTLHIDEHWSLRCRCLAYHTCSYWTTKGYSSWYHPGTYSWPIQNVCNI